jgi:hypothetical protein
MTSYQTFVIFLLKRFRAMVTHDCNLAEIGRIMVQDQHGQKVHEIPSQPIKSWVCHPSNTRSINRRIAVHLGHKVKPYLKNN